MKGFVKNIKADKQFGFIKVGEKEYFFHVSEFHGFWEDLVNDMKKDSRIEVEFDEVESDKGLRAGNVRRLDYPNQHP